MIGNDYFVSDGNDIKLKAIWSKVSLKKSMDGTIYEVKPVLKETPYDYENDESYQGEFWNEKYRANTTKIIIQNALNPIEEAVESWDVSEAGDRSVMAYAVLNDDGQTYTIYLQGNGKIIANEDSSYLFCYFYELNSIEGLEYLDTSQVINMSSMFSFCSSIIELDLNSFDTSQVTDMNSMFFGCQSLTSLDVSNFNTSQVTDMNSMFSFCESLTKIDVNNFDTSQVTNMYSMFSNCYNLIELELNNFDTSKVTDMSYMFYCCINLVELDLSNFDTSKVTDMSDMFSTCESLTELNLRNADFSCVSRYASMFRNTSELNVIVKDETARSWIQDKLGSNGTAIIAE